MRYKKQTFKESVFVFSLLPCIPGLRCCGISKIPALCVNEGINVGIIVKNKKGR